MSTKKADELRAKGKPAGDCVDCRQCVAVCPTGIDIRDGAQLECIMCGLCIDACDNVMEKIGRPTRLIAYDNEINIQRRMDGEPEIYRPVRSRTIVYTIIIAAVGGLMLYTLLTRALIDVSVLHDRNPLFVALSDGSVRNAYTVRFINKRPEARAFSLDVEGLPYPLVTVVGTDSIVVGEPLVAVGPDQTREVRVLVTVPAGRPLDKSTPVTFTAVDMESRETATARDHFIAP